MHWMDLRSEPLVVFSTAGTVWGWGRDDESSLVGGTCMHECSKQQRRRPRRPQPPGEPPTVMYWLMTTSQVNSRSSEEWRPHSSDSVLSTPAARASRLQLIALEARLARGPAVAGA
jgi:hypothetical protein